MRTLIAAGIAALLTLAVVISWATATARSNSQPKALAASGGSLNPFELMKNSTHLPQRQYDAF